MEISDQLARAFKKLKATTYYDKTLNFLCQQLVEYEQENNLEERFLKIAQLLTTDNKETWLRYVRGLLNSIEILYFPKEVQNTKSDIITNVSEEQVIINKIQNYISINVEGHILGVFWILLVGAQLDKDLYKHSYGNRLRENLINEENSETSYSPNLFKPYFTQYESWRDIALNYAQRKLKDGEDVLILTLDFKQYFYSINFHKGLFDIIESEVKVSREMAPIVKKLNDFIYMVIEKYSDTMSMEHKNFILPIGFLPSNILSNWYLKKFDAAILDRWNPVYYGRYVDDIIIVDKVEKNSYIHSLVLRNKLKKNDVIEYYLCNCNAFKEMQCRNERVLLIHEKKFKEELYYVNPVIMDDENVKLTIQENKFKIFYFNHNNTDALISCFRKEIAKNNSEFRYLPDDEQVLEQNDYSEIYNLNFADTVNKLRGLEELQINKFALSKFIGKYLKISTLINDKIEFGFEKDIKKIFDSHTLINNYTLWEKVLLIFVANNKFKTAEKFIEQIVFAIVHCNSGSKTSIALQHDLLNYLFCSITRAYSINWGKNVRSNLEEIGLIVRNLCKKQHIQLNGEDFSYIRFTQSRMGYCYARMCDKNLLPLPIDCIIDQLDFNDDDDINFCDFKIALELAKDLDWEKRKYEYKYYPYIISPQELEVSLILDYIVKNNGKIDQRKLYEKVSELFYKLNFQRDAVKHFKDVDVKEMSFLKQGDSTVYAIKVGNFKRTTWRIGVANSLLYYQDFYKVLKEEKNRSFDRYRNLKNIVNDAIKHKADILVMPESYVPFEWLQLLSKVCAKTKMAIITGVEHICYDEKIYNLTATILPYEEESYCFSHIIFHNKVHFSPEEKLVIRSYGYQAKEGCTYELFNYNDLWFPVYCCFELASIKDRSIFQSYSDLLIAVEWNKDVNYYSNVIEALDRDLHCYCVQVNTSDYGDSRIVKPAKTEVKDIVRTKGGENSTVLIGKIDIKQLREFQIKGYELQSRDKQFKTTPPQFDTKVVRDKIHGVLWDRLS